MDEMWWKQAGELVANYYKQREEVEKDVEGPLVLWVFLVFRVRVPILRPAVGLTFPARWTVFPAYYADYAMKQYSQRVRVH